MLQVKIRKFDRGDLILIFPDVIADTQGKLLLSYQYRGEHGGCSPELLDELPTPDNNDQEEVNALLQHYQNRYNIELKV